MLPALGVIASYLSPSLPALLGTSVFGLTASTGQLITDCLGGRSPEDFTSTESGNPMGRGAERRRDFRNYSSPVRIEVAFPRLKRRADGWAVDHSAGGLALHLESRPRLWEVVEVCPCTVPGLKVWVRALITNCRMEADAWRAGCQFLDTPPWGVLRLFG